MDSLWQALSGHGSGLNLSFWKCVGWTGNVVFFSRFMIQWYVTEKRRQVVVPRAFWWLSLAGCLLLLVYSIHSRDFVFIFAYAFAWLPYMRNLVIHHRHKAAEQLCPACATNCTPAAFFCHQCGMKLAPQAPPFPEGELRS
jgi:lipid-A-disaccharide synthase-like uncharacterized protein